MLVEFYPSLISSDLLNLGRTLRDFDPYVAGYHIDVMDNHFVPNLTWGAQFVNALIHSTELPMQIHLMVDDPLKWTDKLELRTKDYFIFHIEAARDHATIVAIIEKVRQRGWKVGMALNPKSEPEAVAPYLGLLDIVLVMAVEPGFSGQKFMPEVLKKIPVLRTEIESHGYATAISMDGGINATTITDVVTAGVKNIGLASALFAKPNPVSALLDLKALIRKIPHFST